MGKTAVIFAGQGSQYEKQGAKLYEKYPEIRDIYDGLEGNLKRISFEGTMDELSETKNLQPLMVAFQLAALRLLKDKINVDATCGLSLGEYSAITLAGIIDEKKALELVSKRGELMSEASKLTKSKMLAFLKVTEDDVRELMSKLPELEGKVYIANINSPKQIVVSGEELYIDVLARLAKDHKIIARPLAVSGAFHTPFMDTAKEGFAAFIKDMEFAAPEIDYYPNLTGEKYDGRDMKEVLPLQIVSPVLFYKTFKNMVDDGVNHFIEIGPGGVLSNIIRREFKDVSVDTFKNDDDLIAYLQGE